jgi:hypothetical protein
MYPNQGREMGTSGRGRGARRESKPCMLFKSSGEPSTILYGKGSRQHLEQCLGLNQAAGAFGEFGKKTTKIYLLRVRAGCPLAQSISVSSPEEFGAVTD